MKNALIISGILFLFSSCDTRKDFYESINQAPLVEVRKYSSNAIFTTDYSDSIKKGFSNYVLEIRTADEEHLPVIFSSDISTDQSTIPSNKVSITFDDMFLGIHTVTLKMTDSFKKEGMAVGLFTVFDNILPEVLFTITLTGIHDPLEYNIDASASFDGDKKYGGEINQYEFMINNSYKVTTPLNNINYIFPSSGLYTISVRVRDNNGAWSAYKTQVVNI